MVGPASAALLFLPARWVELCFFERSQNAQAQHSSIELDVVVVGDVELGVSKGVAGSRIVQQHAASTTSQECS